MFTRLVLVAVLTGSAAAEPVVCPNDAERCDLTVTGTLTSSKRDRLAKWDNLRISTTIDGKRRVVGASINIPHRKRLALKPGTRYRFTIAAHAPFGAHNLWVVDAKRL